MFWGLIMEPNKRYTQVVEKAFHISHAAMDTSTGDNDPCQVMVVVDGKNFLVCTLQKNKNIQVPLDLYFKAKDSISFLTNGKCNVHLTGYLDPEYEEDLSEEEEDEDDEDVEVPTLVPAKNKRKLDNSNDATTSKKAKQEKKAKKAAVADSSDDEDDDDEKDQLQKFLDGEDIDTDDNDESFKMNSTGEGTSEEEDDDDDDEEEEDDDDEEEKDSDEAETTLDTSKDSKPEVDMSKLSKSQKRRLKKKLQQQAKEKPQVNGVDKVKKDKPEAQQKEKKKQEKKEAQEADKSAEKKEKKSLSGGIQVEDTKVGTGAIAKPGKVVMVYYEGRLKQNNKMFDNCLKGPGFKFRLGAKEVISGWDIGIAGMKVGGKRRITCPPAMAYGAKGSPPVIPPNSTLVFEVELKNVK